MGSSLWLSNCYNPGFRELGRLLTGHSVHPGLQITCSTEPNLRMELQNLFGIDGFLEDLIPKKVVPNSEKVLSQNGLGHGSQKTFEKVPGWEVGQQVSNQGPTRKHLNQSTDIGIP